MLIDPPSRSQVFTVSPPSFNIPPGQSQPENVQFQPDGPINSAAVIISTNDATQPTIGVVLSGSGLAGKLSVPASINITTPVNPTTQAS